MSASARGTASDYSKGLPVAREDLALAARGARGGRAGGRGAPARRGAVAAVHGRRRRAGDAAPQRVGGSHHGWALAVVAIAAAVDGLRRAARRARRGGRARRARRGGAARRARDRPAGHAPLGQPAEAIAYADARAKAGSGLALELAGGVTLLSRSVAARGGPPRLRILSRDGRQGASAVQSTGRSGSVSTACHVAASVVPVAGRPRAVWKARSTASVAAVKRPPAVTTIVGSNDARCCCSQMTWSPREPRLQRGPAGIGGDDRRRRGPAERRPRRLARRLPAPPRHAARAVARPDRAEARARRRRSRRRRPARSARSARRRCGSARRSSR